MSQLPVIVHVFQLVTDLAAVPPELEDPRDSNDHAQAQYPSTPPDSLEDGSKAVGRKSHVYRVGRRRTKRWRGLPRAAKQRRSLTPEKSRVDRRLGGTDPFGAFDLPQDSTTDLALHHWASVFQNTRMPITPRRAWMKINLSDKTLLSVTTYCSTYHFYFIRGMKPPPICFSQKLKAIQNINKSLGGPESSPNDYIMVAVACMTLFECLGGEPMASSIHRKGLQMMIQARGGLQNLGFDGAVQRTISWADTCSAILLGIKPTLSPSLIPNAGESAIPGFTAGDLKTRLDKLTASPELTRTTLFIWLRLRYLTEFLTTIPQRMDSKIDECFFSDKIDFIERTIIFMLHSETLAQSSSVAFLTAFLNASLIFVYEELRECPKWNNVCICLSQRIYSGLQMVDLSLVAEHCPDLVLWILLLGRSGISPFGGPSKPWYFSVIAGMELTYKVKVPVKVAGLKYFHLAEQLNTRPQKVIEAV